MGKKSHEYQSPLTSNLEVLEILENSFIRSIEFVQFVEKTAPKTKNTSLSQLAQSMVGCFFSLCQPDEKGNFGLIRGGSMRSFLFNNYITDDYFAVIFENTNPQLFGQNPLAPKIIDKVFSLPKDIDIFFRVTTPHCQFHQNNILFQTINDFLQQSGFKLIGQDGKKDEILLTDGKYQIKIMKHQTGIIHPQTLVKVDVSENSQTLLKLHFGLLPDENERQEDPRFFDDEADIDEKAVGYLTKTSEDNVLIRYFGMPELNYVCLYLINHFFDPLMHPFKIDWTKKPNQLIAARLREINFRIALISWLFYIKGIVGLNVDLQQTPYYQLFIKYGINFERKPLGEQEMSNMVDWFNYYQKNLQDHFKLIASDIIYGLTVNPFLFFLFAFISHILDAFPLGKLLDFERLRHFLESLAEEVGGNLNDSLLTLSVKYYHSLKTAENTTIFHLLKFLDKSLTVSEFLKLITFPSCNQ